MTTTLITCYWGDLGQDDGRVRRLYDEARKALQLRYNTTTSEDLEVYDLSWLPEGHVEHFLVRASSVNDLVPEPQLTDLVELLKDEGRLRQVGTGLALYGSGAEGAAQEISTRAGSTKPTNLRFLVHAFVPEDLEDAFNDWMDQAAGDVIARASAVDSERLIGDLLTPGARTTREKTWDL